MGPVMSDQNRIHLRVSEPGGVDRPAWPVTQGIAFADRTLERGMPVGVVDANGKSLPCQTCCLTTWDSDLRFVKWLLVDFQVDLPAGKSTDVFVEYGDHVEPALPAQPVTIDQVDEQLVLETGPMQLVLSHSEHHYRQRRASFLMQCSVRAGDGWRDLFRDGSGPHLYMTDGHGRSFDSVTAAPRPVITVEESGPVRACVRIDGYHANSHGVKVCPFTLRIHAYAGKSDLRVHHTFVFDQDADHMELSAIGMKFPLALGDDRKMAFGGDQGGHVCDEGADAVLVQRTDRDFVIAQGDRTVATGAKSGGWATLGGDLACAAVVVRNFWQEYPKSIALGGDGTIDVQIWPASHDENLSFTTPFKEEAIFFGTPGHFGTPTTRDESYVKRLLHERPTAPLNLKSFNIQNEQDLEWVERVIDEHAPDRLASYNDTADSDGTGAAKTTEFVLRFSSAPIAQDEAAALGVAVQEPVIAPPSSEYLCATGAMGPFGANSDPRFAPVHEALDEIVRLYILEPREFGRLYGMMRYGNLLCVHSDAVGVVYRYYRDRDPSKAFRRIGVYNNEANDQVHALWCNFVRTADRGHFLLAEAYSQNVADVAICHAHPGMPKVVGLIHYHNAHQWSGGHSPSHSLTAGLMLHYYFTGNRRLLDVALEVADWAVRNQEPCGIISNREGVLHRELTGPLWCVIEAYKATWNRMYGDLARRTLNWLLKTQRTPGEFPISIYTRGDTGDEAFVETVDISKGRYKDAVGQHFAAGGIARIYTDGMRLFPGELLRRTIIAEAGHILFDTPTGHYYTQEMARRMTLSRYKLWHVGDGWYWSTRGPELENNGGIVCLAYELTGDVIYAAWARYMVEVWFPDCAKRLGRFCPCDFECTGYAATLPALAAVVAEALNRDPQGLVAAEATWKQQRAKRGNPVYDGPAEPVPIDYEHFDANGNIISMMPADIGVPDPVRRPQAVSIGRLNCENEVES